MRAQDVLGEINEQIPMKKSRFPEAEIMGVLRQSDRGRVATEWLWTYNNERPNMGIGGLAPAKKMKMVA